VSDAGVVWAEIPDEDGDEPDAEAHGDVDQSFAARRLRRWLKGMFGGRPTPPLAAEPDPDREHDES
jgi:hypothetical protein